MMKQTAKRILLALYLLAAGAFVLIGLGAMAYGIRTSVLAIGCGALMLALWLLGCALKKRRPRLCALASRAVAAVFLLALAVSLAASAQIASCYFDDDAPEDAVMVILGCGLSSADGVSPSLVMHRRLAAAEAYLSAHPETVCVLSGGQGPGENITEALAMFRFLTERGIDESRLYLEEQSTSTRENLQFSRALLLAEGLIPEEAPASLLVVTDGFHQFRAQQLGGALGFDCYSVSAHAPLPIVCIYWLREVPAIASQVWLPGA